MVGILFVELSIESKRLNYGIAYLSAVCKEAGHETSLLEVTNPEREEIHRAILAKLRNFPAKVLAISLNEVYSDIGEEVAYAAKSADPSILVIAGGAYPSLVPEQVLSSPNFDAVLIGEAEISLISLLSCNSNKSPEWKFPKKLKGVYYKRNGKISKGGLPVLPNLDSLPLPDISLFGRNALAPRFGGKRHMGAIVSRGCVFSCTYCYSSRIGNPEGTLPGYYRRFSPDRAIEVIQHVSEKARPDWIFFLDPIFFPSVKIAGKFPEMYSREIGIPCYGVQRPDLCTREMAGAMKKCLAEKITMGIESASEDLRRRVLGRNIPDATLEKGFKNVRRAGISPGAFSMIGFPYQPKKDVIEICRISAKIADYNEVSMFFPEKGTVLGNLCHKNGWVDTSKKQRSFGEANTVLLTNGEMDRATINSLYLAVSPLTKYYKRDFLGAAVASARMFGRIAFGGAFGGDFAVLKALAPR